MSRSSRWASRAVAVSTLSCPAAVRVRRMELIATLLRCECGPSPGWMARVVLPGRSRQVAMAERNGTAASPLGGIRRTAQPGQSSCGTHRARAASCAGLLRGMDACAVPVR